MTWEVLVKGDVEKHEISVIRKGNLFGHQSWGWFDPDEKIMIASSHIMATTATPESFARWKAIAQRVADALNEPSASQAKPGAES